MAHSVEINNTEEYEQAMRVSAIFYNRYKSLCHGSSRRHEIKRLYEDTQHILLKISGDTKSLRFSQILYALSYGHNVLRVLGGNEIQWNVFNKTFNKFKQHPEKMETYPRHNKNIEFEEEPLWYNYNHDDSCQTYDSQPLLMVSGDNLNQINQLYENNDDILLPLGEFYTITGE